ncbi:MAG: hypothetical protein HY786_06815 [Deltaproteobacteria bacterium]|nr:hypothetical protein [Deltaproteobacteria bacterium]
MLDKLKEELYIALKRDFPSAKVEVDERRGIVIEARAHINQHIFIEVYANGMTGKRSFALISEGNRIAGYDNYRFWHCHPHGATNEHLPCDEPQIDSVISDFKEILKSL